jgi:hypothetical protein
MRVLLPEPGSTVLVPLFDEPIRFTGRTERRLRVTLLSGEQVDAIESDIPAETDEQFKARCDAYQLRKDIRLRVRLLPSNKVRELANGSRQLRQRERTRQFELKKQFPREHFPEVYEEDTPEGILEYAKQRRAILEAGVVGLENVLIGSEGGAEVDSASITDVARLIEILELANWDERAAMVVMRAQSPTPKQRLS